MRGARGGRDWFLRNGMLQATAGLWPQLRCSLLRTLVAQRPVARRRDSVSLSGLKKVKPAATPGRRQGWQGRWGTLTSAPRPTPTDKLT